MQEYCGSLPTNCNLINKFTENHACAARECNQESSSYTVNQRSFFQKNHGYTNQEFDHSQTSLNRIVTESETSTNHQQRYSDSSATFSSAPHSPLVGLVFDSTSDYGGSSSMSDRLNPDRHSQSSWSGSHQEPIGTGVKKKIVKGHDKRNTYNADPRYQDKYKDPQSDQSSKKDKKLTSESTSSLDFFAEGERMVSELCNIPDPNSRNEMNSLKCQKSTNQEQDDNSRNIVSSEMLLTALDKIIIHNQIPNQIVQLAIEACTDAENIAIAHHNRPCFKNIHSICAKTRSNVQKPDSAVANLHSQGIPWVIKNFIFSFVRILDGWKGVKELLSEKHDTFSRIENKYYSQNIRECFVQWQAVTKEMLTHIYKTFKCLDDGFIMEQKSFTRNYYATNSAAPRHQNRNKFQSIKQPSITPRSVNPTPLYNVLQPPWLQPQARPPTPQGYNENVWAMRSNVPFKKTPVLSSQTSQNFYQVNDQEIENYQKTQYKCDPCCVRESKPRQSWTIANVSDCRVLEGICHAEQREVYSQLQNKIDAELGKASSKTIIGSNPSDLLQRREMELKSKIIPLSHVEKNLIPNISSTGEVRSYVQKNNSCGDTKEEADFFAVWGQMVQKEPSDFLTHQSHNIQMPSSVVTISNNSGPVQFLETENDEFHELSKVYMKPGSYKVPIKVIDPASPFLQNATQDIPYDATIDETPLKTKSPYQQITLAPQPKYNIELWPCVIPRRSEEVSEDQKTKTTTDRQIIDSFNMLSSMISDQAWEAAKQLAPKLMDFIHEGSRPETSIIYDALGLSANDERLQQSQFRSDSKSPWGMSHMSTNTCTEWNQKTDIQDLAQDDNESNDGIVTTEDNANISSNDQSKKTGNTEPEYIINKKEESKEKTRRRKFDLTGNFVKDESQKKFSGKSKIEVSGTWYHPKKKKPISNPTVKKFETILNNLSHLHEAAFIQHDMDIKVAPRFYEVVKHPMCLNDITTKLMNSFYTEYDQVVQDFRRIFNNVRLYLKTYPDSTMKKYVNKISSEFEKMLFQEFQNKTKSHENEVKDQNIKKIDKTSCAHKTESKKEESKPNSKLEDEKI